MEKSTGKPTEKPVGKIVLDLPPSKENPRNSEGAFLSMGGEKVLFIYSRFEGETADDTAYACLSARYSPDGGKTWTGDRIILRPQDDGAMNIMSVSLMRMQNGDVGLFYGIRHGWHDARLHLRRSSDDGRTWGPARCCIPAPGYFVTNNDRVVRLSTGRLIIPAAYHRMKLEDTVNWEAFDHRGVTLFFYSDDDGDTWKESASFCALPAPDSMSGLQEPGLVELLNHALWAWGRTDMGRQYEMFSRDGGVHWTLPQPSFFTSPCSPLSMKRRPSNGSLFAVWNPVPAYGGPDRRKKLYRDRTPLMAAISRDDGVTWSKGYMLEDDENSNYCYTAIHYTEDAVLLAYCAGSTEDGDPLARLRIRRIPLEELE